MKAICLSFLLLLAFAAGGESVELASYRTLEKTCSVNLLKDPSFDSHTEEAECWVLSDEAKITEAAGLSQRGLQIKRSDPTKYTITWQKIPLKPGKRYIFGGKLRVTDSDGRSSGAIGIEGFRNSTKLQDGQMVFCQYLANSGNFDWKELSKEFSVPGDTDIKYYFICYYLKNRCGTASYDDLYVREAGAEYYAGLLNPYNRIEGDNRTIIFTMTVVGKFSYDKKTEPAISAIAEVKDASGNLVLSDCQAVKDGRFCVDGKALADGEHTIDVTVIDTANKIMMGKIENLYLHVGTPKVRRPAKGAVDIDKYGRTIIDGKPFMPIGCYVGSMGRMYDVKYFADSPFNCVMLYSGYNQRLSEYKEGGAEGVLKMLDILDQNGLKAIFGIPFLFDGYQNPVGDKKAFGLDEKASNDEFVAKVADAVREHPAILGWFLTDELAPPRYRELVERRKIVNEHDPYHPTCGVYFLIYELPAYSSTQDVPTIDFYPIIGKNVPHSQSLISESMIQAKKVWTHPETGEMPLWATPQLFSWGGDDPRKNPNYHFPTENEILSMSVMSAIHGAKGFLFYYYFCVLYGAGTTLDEKFETFGPNWKNICAALKELKALEPFIMSTSPAPKVTVKDIKGKTYARAFVDEEYGRIRVLISCDGPGDAEAEIKIEDFSVPVGGRNNELRSKLQKTQRIDMSTYLFKGKDVDCDILQRWPEYELDKPIIEMEKTRKEAGVNAETQQ